MDMGKGMGKSMGMGIGIPIGKGGYTINHTLVTYPRGHWGACRDGVSWPPCKKPS